MRQHKLSSFVLITLLLLSSNVWAGLGSHKTMYVGGTVPGLKEKTEGVSSTQNADVFLFDYSGGKLSIPYKQVNSLEYGQKAGRRVGMAIAISPVMLFSKKRRHYLTVGYLDEAGKQQAAVFELGKDIIRSTLTDLEARTGKKIEYQDEEARKSATGKK